MKTVIPEEKRKILIVDDEANLLHYYSIVLGKFYDLSCCTHGAMALQFINSSQKYNLALVDYKLPDICGLELLRKIKVLSPTLPVVIITAYGDEGIAVRSFHYGATDYLKKPFGYEEFLKKIKSYTTHNFADLTNDRMIFHEMYERNDSQVARTSDQGTCHNYYKIQKAIKYIDENYMMKISLNSVANVACTSRYHFSKIFRKEKGITYREYINRIRINKAKQLLRENTSTITEVAHAIGYDDITHFGRVFKSIVNSTPSEYRQYYSGPQNRTDNVQDIVYSKNGHDIVNSKL